MLMISHPESLDGWLISERVWVASVTHILLF
jgi:hypothetical protein